MRTFVLLYCVCCVVGCSKDRGQQKSEKVAYEVITEARLGALTESGEEGTFCGVLGTIKEGFRSGDYVLFPGKGKKTPGFLLERFNALPYEPYLSKLKPEQSVWIKVRGKCRAYSAPYAKNPLRDPWGVIYDYSIDSVEIAPSPRWEAWEHLVKEK
ncbi:MAG: hypothetical protein AMXMBFR7_50390 [Planctomycetota bacterium]